MIHNSLSWHILCVCFNWFKNLINESLFFNAFIKFFALITKVVQESFVYKWLGKDVFTQKFYETSLFYNIVQALWQFVLKIVRSVQLFTRKIFKNSLCLTVFDFLNAKNLLSIDCFLALFLGMMFIVPHGRWNNLYAFLAAMFFAFWIVMNMASGKIKSKSVKGLGISIVAFVIAIGVSTVTAIVFSDAVRIALFLIASVVFTYGVYLGVDSREKLVRFIKIILFFVSITGLYAIAQRIMGVEVDLEFVDITTNEGMPGRVYSTFSNPNNFAQLLVLFMPFFVPLFFSVKSKIEKLVISGAFCVCVGALAMTYSRSGWVGIALAAVLFVCLYDKRLLIPMGILVIMAIPFLPDTIMNRIFTIGSMKDSSNSYRLYIWDSCLRMIKDYGITGLGLGPMSFRAVYPGYSSPIAVTAPHSHMLYMEIILEMGIMGALSFFAYMLATVKKAAGSMRIMDKELRTYAVAGLSALLGIAFVCCAEYIWFYPRVMFAFWILPGLLLSIVKIAKNENA